MARSVNARREKIVELKESGVKNTEIAKKLGVKKRTIYRDLASLKGKLKVAGDKKETALKAQTTKVAKQVIEKAAVAKQAFKQEVSIRKGASAIRVELKSIQQEQYISKLEGLIAKQAIEIASLKA
jgi:IS30 family transposase